MSAEQYSQLEDAIHETVHGFAHHGRRGAEALAPLIGVQPGTLRNKANPDILTHQLTVAESVPVQLVTNNFAIHEALDRLFGRVSIPAAFDLSRVTNEDLVGSMGRWQAEVGETAAAVIECLEGASPDPDRLATVERELYQDMQKGLELLRRLKARKGAR